MGQDTVKPVVDAAERLVDLVRDATVMVAFSEDGMGPYMALEDDNITGGPGRIRKAAEQLRQRLLDHDRAELSRT